MNATQQPIPYTREHEHVVRITKANAGICHRCDTPLVSAVFAWNDDAPFVVTTGQRNSTQTFPGTRHADGTHCGDKNDVWLFAKPEYVDVSDFARDAVYGCKPEITDLSDIVTRATSTTDQYGKRRAAWAKESDATCRANFKRAIRISYRQESYSDDTIYLVPFTGNVTDESKRRMVEFLRRADSHTGFSGSGSNYRLGTVYAEGYFAVHCRASIGE